VKRSVYTLFLFLTASVLLVSVVPLSDIPETAYNETETPVNQGPPVQPGTTFLRPSITSVILPKRVREAGRCVGSQSLKRHGAYPLYPRDPRSLQVLLCTYLL
jgi:hypothetical protein